MRDSTRTLLDALMGAAGGIPTAPGFGLPGLTGVERPPAPWDTVTAARAPEVPGEILSFVALGDGTLVVDDDIPDGSATPLAEAVEQELAPPYEAAAVRREDEDGLWRVAAVGVLIAPAGPGGAERVELARVGDVVTATIDGVDADAAAAPQGLVDLLGRREGDAALTAERLDEATWVAQRWAL